MSTIAQEITRIQGGANDVWDYCEDNGVTVPAGTKIDEARTYLDQIPHGGTENSFLQLTDLTGLFCYKAINESKWQEGLVRYGQNVITTLNHTFERSTDNDTTDDTALRNVAAICNKNTIVDAQYALYYFSNYNSNNYNKTLDLSNMRVSGDARYMFSYFGNNLGSLKLILNNEAFKNATNLEYLFDNLGISVKIQLNENKLYFNNATRLSYLFNRINSRQEVIDSNGNPIKNIDIYVNDSNSVNISYMLQNCTLFEYVNFKNNDYGFNSAEQVIFNNQTIKGITGLNFNRLTGTSNFTGSIEITNLGEFGIVSGSNIGSGSNSNLNLRKMWVGAKSAIRDGQTIEYWYEKFANALGTSPSGTHTITINTTLYNSLTQEQKELITNKGYILAYAS